MNKNEITLGSARMGSAQAFPHFLHATVLYISLATRPDISHVSALSRYSWRPFASHLTAAALSQSHSSPPPALWRRQRRRLHGFRRRALGLHGFRWKSSRPTRILIGQTTVKITRLYNRLRRSVVAIAKARSRSHVNP